MTGSAALTAVPDAAAPEPPLLLAEEPLDEPALVAAGPPPRGVPSRSTRSSLAFTRTPGSLCVSRALRSGALSASLRSAVFFPSTSRKMRRTNASAASTSLVFLLLSPLFIRLVPRFAEEPQRIIASSASWACDVERESRPFVTSSDATALTSLLSVVPLSLRAKYAVMARYPSLCAPAMRSFAMPLSSGRHVAIVAVASASASASASSWLRQAASSA